MPLRTTLLYSIGMIGGADGPTAVYVTGPSDILPVILAVAGAAVVVALVIRFLRHRK